MFFANYIVAVILICLANIFASQSSVVPIMGNSTGDSFDKMKYDHVVVRGLPFERGFAHGSLAKSKIERSLHFYKTSGKLLPWDECLNFARQHYLPALEKYYKRGLEEMRGIAKGAGVNLEDIIVLNARYDLSRVQRLRKIQQSLQKEKVNNASTVSETTAKSSEIPTPGECTGAVALSSATESGHVLLGQNWDIQDTVLINDTAIVLEVHPDPTENIKPFVVLTEAGQLVRSGMNSDGMGVIAMSLWSTGDLLERDPARHPYGWLPLTLIRRMFLESPNFSVGIKNVLQVPRHVSGSIIIATAEDEAVGLEVVPDKYFSINVPTEMEILSHSNHFKSPAFRARDDIEEGSRGSSSLFRDRRVYRALQSYHPDINEESFQVGFRDHVGHPNSVCEHSVPPELAYTSASPTSTTVASVIYNLSKRTYQVAKGPPCKTAYQNYTLGQPSELPQQPTTTRRSVQEIATSLPKAD